ILVLLIGTSLFLSFILWTYQPNYKQFYDTSYVNEVDVGGGEVSKTDLIKPQHILFYKNELEYGFENPLDKNKLYESMLEWTFYDYEVSIIDGEEEEIGQFIEITYPVPIPTELLSSMFSFNESINLPSWSFDHIKMTLDEQSHTVKISIYAVDNRN